MGPEDRPEDPKDIVVLRAAGCGGPWWPCSAFFPRVEGRVDSHFFFGVFFLTRRDLQVNDDQCCLCCPKACGPVGSKSKESEAGLKGVERVGGGLFHGLQASCKEHEEEAAPSAIRSACLNDCSRNHNSA